MVKFGRKSGMDGYTKIDKSEYFIYIIEILFSHFDIIYSVLKLFIGFTNADFMLW